MMKVVFAGTPRFSVACLQALMDADGIEVVGVVSQPDRKSGRGMKLTPSPIKKAALAAGIDVITPEKLRNNEEALNWLLSKEADMLVVVAFGMILPKSWLDAARIAPINVHASLLPRWRGAAPIERSLLAGDDQTGVCIMHMEEGLDTGGVYASETLPITLQTTGSELWFSLAPMGAKLLIETLPKIAAGLKCVPQTEEGITYAKKLRNEERVIDWACSADEIDRQVRCFSPKPGMRTSFKGKSIKLIRGEALNATTEQENGVVIAVSDGLDVACNGSIYRILELQPEGKKAMDVTAFLCGSQVKVGDRLT